MGNTIEQLDVYTRLTAYQDHFTVLIAAAMFNIAFIRGDAQNRFPEWMNPFFLIKKLALTAEHKLNRTRRNRADRFLRGLLLTVILITAAGFLGREIAKLPPLFKEYAWLAEAGILALLMPMRQIGDVVRGIMLDFERVSLKEMREKLEPVCVHDTSHLDHFAVFRTATELCANSLLERILSLTFWYLIFGLPGVFILLTVNLLNEAFGYDDPRFSAFGTTASGLYMLANLPMIPIAGFMLILASLATPLAKPHLAIAAFVRGLINPMTAHIATMAGALDARLLGPRPISEDHTVNQAWVEKTRSEELAFTHVRTAYTMAKICWTLYGIALIIITM